MAVHVDRDFFSEMTAGAMGSNRHFRAPLLPAAANLTAVAAFLQQVSRPRSKLAFEEGILTAIYAVAHAAGINRQLLRRPSAAAIRRMSTVCEYIDARLASDLSLAELSAHVAMSKYHFLRTFKHTNGMTPHQYIMARRLSAVAMALRSSKASVARIALDHGFSDLSTFNRLFRRVIGITPTAYRSDTPGSPI
jgi:AraC-like DNA-binding protein